MGSVARPKVICIGYGRTGTMSLMAALNELGFGPCYHTRVIVDNQDVNEIGTWYNLGQGLASLDDLRTLLRDYNSFLDFPIALNCDKLYKAYPDAKFILTTRDPVKWAKSMEATVIPTVNLLKNIPDPNPFVIMLSKWYAAEMESRLFNDLEKGLVAHTQRVKATIPAEQLLEYDVGQGWEPLVDFLGVEKPSKTFPHVNRTEDYLEELRKFHERA